MRRRTAKGEGAATPFVCYGGAGFGGKSYGIRTAAVELNGQLAKEGFPGQWGCVMTSSYPQLSDRQLSRLHAELGHLGRVKSSRMRHLHFEFYQKELGGFYLRNADDPSKYKGGQFAWVQVDELTELTRENFDDLTYALRSGEDLPFKSFGGATNPDGIGHVWVKKWWIERDFTDDPLKDPDDFVFIQAKAWDNPKFDKTIEAKLRGHSDPMIVKARWEGSWDLNLGVRFSLFNRQVHEFDWPEFLAAYGREEGSTFEELVKDEDLFAIYGDFDYGTSEDSAAAFHLHAIDHHGNVWTFLEVYMQGYYLDDQAEILKGHIYAWRPERVWCDPALMGKDDKGIARLTRFKDRGVFMTPGNNERIEGWATLDTLLHYKRDEHGAWLKRPRWRIHRSCRHLIRQLASAPRSETRMEDVDAKFGDDHALDAARYGLHSHFRGKREKPALPQAYSPAWYRQRRKDAQREQFALGKSAFFD